MWSENDGPYEGRHFQLAETLCSPQPIKRPRILIGGAGERKTLLLVARYGDACNLFGTSADIDRFLASMEEYARLGIDTVWVVPRGPDPAEWVQQASTAAVPKLAEFTNAGSLRSTNS